MNRRVRKELGKVDRRLIGVGLSVAIVVVAAILVLRSGGDDNSAQADSGASIVDVAGVNSLASTLGHPIYWAGPIAEDQLELTRAAGGNIYLRYLPAGVEAGDPHSSFLTVGTYPVEDAQTALARTASSSGSKLIHAPAGGLVLVNPEEPNSVYLAYPESDLQLEVYDPAPGAALGLIRSGKIGPVG
jgi:hypothetical protein